MSAKDSRFPPPHGVPDAAIDVLFGRGLDREAWKTALELNGYSWVPDLKNRIIKREFWYFKDEIGRLLTAPNTNRGRDFKTNSCKSVLRQLKGKTGEAEARLRARTLFSPDAKLRTFEQYVKQWREEDPSYGKPESPPKAIEDDTDVGAFNVGDRASVGKSLARGLAASSEVPLWLQTPSNEQEVRLSDTYINNLNHNQPLRFSSSSHLHPLETSTYLGGNMDSVSPERQKLMDFFLQEQYTNQPVPDSLLGAMQPLQDEIDLAVLDWNCPPAVAVSAPSTMNNFPQGQVNQHMTADLSLEPCWDGTFPNMSFGTFDPCGLSPLEAAFAVSGAGIEASALQHTTSNDMKGAMDITCAKQPLHPPNQASYPSTNNLQSFTEESVDCTAQPFETIADTNYTHFFDDCVDVDQASPVDLVQHRHRPSHPRTTKRRVLRNSNSTTRELRLRQQVSDLKAQSRASKEEVAQKNAEISELIERLNWLEVSASQEFNQHDVPTPIKSQRISHMDDIIFETIAHQHYNDKIIQEAPAARQRALAAKAAYEAVSTNTSPCSHSQRQQNSPKKSSSSDRRNSRSFPSKSAIPLGHALRFTGPPCESSARQSESPSPTESPIRKAGRLMLDTLMGRHRESIPPVPVLRQWKEVHNDIRKRYTGDSGYESLYLAPLADQMAVDGEQDWKECLGGNYV